jgi:hypothetical protein
MTIAYQEGVIPVGGTITVNIATTNLPASITLSSTTGNRAIELTTNGTDFFTPGVDVTQTNFITVSLMAPVMQMRLTGNANDKWNIRGAA